MTDLATEDLLRFVRKRTAVRLWKVLPVDPDHRGAEIEKFMNRVTSSTALIGAVFRNGIPWGGTPPY